MLTEEQFVELRKFNTVEDVFSSSIINAVTDYRDIITGSLFKTELVEPFIIATINNGNEALVVENIDAISLNISWQIAKNNLEFKKILLENFDKAIENSNNIYWNVLEEINKEDQSLLINNWRAIIKGTNQNPLGREELISILNSTEEGKSIVDSNFYELFYGDYTYDYFVEKLIMEGNATKDKIAELILQEPTRMLAKNLELNCSRTCNCRLTCRDR